MDRKLKIITDRIDAVSAYLDSGENDVALSEQRHLTSQSPERAYWHAGYRSALIDAFQLLMAEDDRAHRTDSADGYPRAFPDGKNFH